MKKYTINTLLQLLLLVGAINLVSCQENDIASQAPYPAKMVCDGLELYNVAATSPRTITFNVSSSTPWKIVSDQEWCIASPAMSASSSLVSEISIQLLDNQTSSQRVATLTLSADDVDEQVTININQDYKSSLVIQEIENKMASEGNISPLTVTSNKPWTILSEKIWLSFDKESGEGSGVKEVIQATANPNTGGERTTVVTISNGIDEYQFNVTQSGYILRFAEITDPTTETVFGSDISIKTFEVISNLDWEAVCDNEAVTLTKLSDSQLQVTLSANEFFTTKSIDISLKPADSSITDIELPLLSLTQNCGFLWDNEDVKLNDNGGITLTRGTGNVRVNTVRENKWGTYIWTFSNVAIGDSFFDLNAWPNKGNLNYHIIVSPSGGNISSGGSTPNGLSFWKPSANFEVSKEKINAMNELKLEVLPISDSEMVFKVYINGEKIVECLKPNAWKVDATTPGIPFYFGLISGTTGTVTIDSFKVISYNE